jgi:DNA-binding response OmpR family regulator
VDTHVSRVRRALELDGRHGWKLSSIYQLGYRLEAARR